MKKLNIMPLNCSNQYQYPRLCKEVSFINQENQHFLLFLLFRKKKITERVIELKQTQISLSFLDAKKLREWQKLTKKQENRTKVQKFTFVFLITIYKTIKKQWVLPVAWQRREFWRK